MSNTSILCFFLTLFEIFHDKGSEIVNLSVDEE